MASGLFNEFESTNKSAWIARVEKELRKSYASVAQWEISDQVFIEPYYTADDLAPAAMAEVRAVQRRKPGWLNAIEITTESLTETSGDQLLPFSLDGVGAIFMPARKDLYEKLRQQAEYDKIDLAGLAVYWSGVWEDPAAAQWITQSALKLAGGIADDPLVSFVKNERDPLPFIHHIAKEFSRFGGAKDFKLFCLFSEPYQTLGADPAQELACLTSGLVYYLDQLTDLGISCGGVLQRMMFSVPVGTDFLAEIAKLRALRLLVQRVAGAYGSSVEADDCVVHAVTSRFYQSSIALEENMLRNTSEAMSAVIGGCDLLTVRPHDPTDPQLAPRIARNVSLLLDQECHLQKHADPSAGSYLLDQMTYVLAEEAWKFFLEMEDQGGFVDAWKSGFTTAMLARSWERQILKSRAGRVVVGGNRYMKGGSVFQKPVSPDLERRIETALDLSGTLPNANHP